MQVKSRSYSGRLFRPKPIVHQEPDNSLLIVATSWGARSTGENAIRTVQDYIHSSREDVEVTSPFDKLDCLSPLANTVRIALRLTNDNIFLEENRNEYKSGIEILLLAFSKNEVVIGQVGQPQIFLDRPGINLTPIGTSPDLSLITCRGDRLPAPLPGNMLGLHRTSNVQLSSIKPNPRDRLVLLSRSVIPHEFYAMTRADRDLDSMASVLAKADPENPFWLGQVDL